MGARCASVVPMERTTRSYGLFEPDAVVSQGPCMLPRPSSSLEWPLSIGP